MDDQSLIDMIGEIGEYFKVIVKSAVKDELGSTVKPERFINEEEAKKLLNCSKTQMYYFRVRGIISYVQDDKFPKMIQYDRDSIMNYLESHLKKAF